MGAGKLAMPARAGIEADQVAWSAASPGPAAAQPRSCGAAGFAPWSASLRWGDRGCGDAALPRQLRCPAARDAMRHAPASIREGARVRRCVAPPPVPRARRAPGRPVRVASRFRRHARRAPFRGIRRTAPPRTHARHSFRTDRHGDPSPGRAAWTGAPPPFPRRTPSGASAQERIAFPVLMPPPAGARPVRARAMPPGAPPEFPTI